MSDWPNTLLSLAICIAFATAGGYLVFSQYQATANAEAVEATVTDSAVEQVEVRDEDRPIPEERYRPAIEYRYTYDGETYTSTNLCAGEASGCVPSGEMPDDAEAFVSDHPEGESITVNVRSDDPAKAYLAESTGSSLWGFVLLLGGGVGTLLAVRDALGE